MSNAGRIDWLQMESEIRHALRQAAEGRLTKTAALITISEALGTHTGRGYDYGYIVHSSTGQMRLVSPHDRDI